jgi:hypothetical protein
MSAVRQVQTIEQTGKRWKLGILIFAIMFCVGLFAAIGGAPPGASGTTMAIGAIGYVLVKIGAWWNHG